MRFEVDSLTGAETATADRRLLVLPVHVTAIGLLVLTVAFVINRRLYELSSSHDAITFGCGVATIALIAYLRYWLRFAWLSASIVYLSLFWMFHYGLTFTALVAPGVLANVADWEITWVYWPNVRVAMLIGLLGAAGFVFGAGMAGQPRPGAPATADRAHDPAMFAVGWAIMLAGLAASVVMIVLAGGAAVFAMSYAEVRGDLISTVQTYIDTAQVGCVIAICGAGGRRWLSPLAVFSVFAAFLLVVGLRTQAMVSMVTFAILLSHRGVHFRTPLLISGILASLIIIPVVRVIRTVGIANQSQVNWTDVSPLETFTELGGTLRAVKAYVDWVEGGDDLLLGLTYWAPFDRQILERLIPWRERTPFEQDTRLPERNIGREGSVGLAATGEAYANFGAAGPFIYFSFVGVLFGWLERRASQNPYYCAALGVAMSMFFFNIRGAWLPMPAHILAGLFVLWLCYSLNRAGIFDQPRTSPQPGRAQAA